MKSLGLLALSLFLTLFGNSQIIVTTAIDEEQITPGTGLSLREAISTAPPGSIITFAPALSGQSIILTAGQLLIAKDLTIDASALPDGISINANGAITNHRVLEIAEEVNNITLNLLTITGGNANNGSTPFSMFGGAILINGLTNLTINNSTLSNNSAEFGGAITNQIGIVTINNSTLSNNFAANNGGGIINGGSLTITNSTLSQNSTLDSGGAISNFLGTITLNNSTLSENSASNIGGAISNNGTLNLNNSIVAGNNAISSPNITGFILSLIHI